jgi:hypothetical protein
MIWLFVKRLDFMKFYPERVLDQIATAAYREGSLFFVGNLISSNRPESLGNSCDKPASA